MDKKLLREHIKIQRDLLSKADRLYFSNTIIEKVISLKRFKDAKSIMCFASFGSEVNTFPLLKEIISEGKDLILPRVEKVNGTKQLGVYKIIDLESQLTKGVFGIMEPDPMKCEKVQISEADLILCPGVVFDQKCNRIGYGGGFYDRLFSSTVTSPFKVGIAFDLQIVENLETELFDIPMDIVITEKREFIVTKNMYNSLYNLYEIEGKKEI